MAFTVYAIVKLLHVAFASLWVGATTYDYLFVTRPLAKKGGAAALREYIEHADRSTPFFVAIAIGTVGFGFETSRRLFGSANPLAWPDASPAGGAILAGFALAIAAIVVGAMQVTPNVKASLTKPDAETASKRMFARIGLLAVVDLALLAVLVLLMVGANTGAF